MKRAIYRQLYKASIVGISLVSATFIGLLIGVLLDRWLGTRPWLTLIFLLLGIITGFRDMFRLALSIDDDKDEE